jgi:two-component system sensor histidine kinase UhpB
MLANLSLRTKLSIYVGAAISVAVALCIALFIFQAATRINSESESARRLANDFIVSALPSINQLDKPEAELERLIKEANHLRHARIYSSRTSVQDDTGNSLESPPNWFTRFLTPNSEGREIEVVTKSGFEDKITIKANPADEITEIWQEIKWISIASLGVISATVLIISIVVSNTLSPLAGYVQALSLLDAGKRTLTVAGDKTPEFKIIADRINGLSQTLSKLDEQNHLLIQKMITLQDNERKEIARDLHDEFGPALFMSRICVGELKKKITISLGEDKYLNDWSAVDQNIDKLQQVNRKILGRLRPAALEEMGLSGAIEAMIKSWRKTDPSVEMVYYFPEEKLTMTEIQSLTAYRIIQESLTNIYRHSRATKVNVRLFLEKLSPSSQLVISVADNGIGIGENSQDGIGLRGMKERMLIVGGELKISRLSPSGTEIKALMPLS